MMSSDFSQFFALIAKKTNKKINRHGLDRVSARIFNNVCEECSK